MKFILALSLVFSYVLAQVDYYSVMELSKDCSFNEVIKAHMRLSDKYNPANNPGDREAARKYEQIQRAKAILTDWNLRSIYNQRGENVVKMVERHKKVGRDDNEQRTQDSLIEWQVSLEQLYNGDDIKFTLNKNVVCPVCGGKGGKIATCPKCHGHGVTLKNVQMGPMTVQMQTHCDQCGGQGSWIEKRCVRCDGRKVVQESKPLVAKVERGMKDAEEIIFQKEAEQYPGYVAGDLIFILKQTPHSLFDRIGNNLYMDMEISFEEALLGFTRSIKHLDGHLVTIDRHEVTQPFQTIVMHGEGMPIMNEENTFGDLHITFKVKMPKLTPEEGKKLASILSNSS